MTVKVEVDREGRIQNAAPIVKKFTGQFIEDLVDWMKKQGELKVQILRRV